MNGYAGKILRVDLTTGKIDTIPTQNYEQWVGGIGIGIATFWDEIDKDYLASPSNHTGFEPENVLSLMTGPLQGTLAPGGGRTEICGIAPASFPRPLFSRSNFGGRFAPMLKFAGYDGIILKGAASKPVWLSIVDDKVKLEDASGLWGMDAYEVQEEIWATVSSKGYQEWYKTESGRRTTQRPAVLTIGQAGENKARVAALIHDSGNSAGQGGYGGVFGSKNLKAISVLGTGSVQVARPKELLEARKWLEQYSFDESTPGNNGENYITFFGAAEPGLHEARRFGKWGEENWERPLGCYGCDKACRPGFKDSVGSENQCVEALWYVGPDTKRHGRSTKASAIAVDYLERYGINAYETIYMVGWLVSLHARGLLGPGKKINTDLDMTQVGTAEFAKDLLHKIAFREDIGNDLADGITYAASRWGVLEEDLMSGVLTNVYNIGFLHHGHAIYWAYESIFQARDLNQHQMHIVEGARAGWAVLQTPEQEAKRIAEIIAPWHDELCADNSEANAYSIHMARLVAFHFRYGKFYVGSAMYCDWDTPSYFNNRTEDGKGISPELETRFLNAVTGRDLSYEDGLEIGRKIWNFERAILVMQDKHRNEEYFPPFPPYDSFIYTDKAPFIQSSADGPLLAYKDGQWVRERESTTFPLSKEKMDEFKSIYYELEGWDPKSGRPTEKSLEECGLEHVAEELKARGKIGAN